MKERLTIHRLIGLNKLQYLNYTTFQYNLWCEVLSYIFHVPVRELQANMPLWNWFNKKWELSIVAPFLEENKDYILAGVEHAESFRGLFQDKVNYIFGPNPNYPGPIIKTIREQHYKNLQK